MAEYVEVVVKIPKYYLTHPQDYSCLAECVRRGTPLPKGHGNLIDAKAYKEKVFRKFPCNDWDDSYIRRLTELVISDAPIIIKADKESEE